VWGKHRRGWRRRHIGDLVASLDTAYTFLDSLGPKGSKNQNMRVSRNLEW
jgi:hypothetical protein